MRRLWVYGVFECSPELVALLSGVVALQMPQTLLFQKVFEAARSLFRVVFCSALNSRDGVVWLAFAIRTRIVVVVATSMIPVVVIVVVAICVVLAFTVNGVILGIRLVLFVSP
jgi:hypothetical protein